ncbi:MAG: glycerol-phosphatase [Solirubrobacterales bacterium]|jgi:HAD superfamily hydrolase (TIGR01450 family)|nr:glycerol-phosphatase [Solirubrobacterales bacterium]
MSLRKKYKTFHPYPDRPNSLSREMTLADQFDGFLIDLDGVVWVGREFLPGAAEALRELREAGKEIVFVTNNPGRPPATYAERLREAGVPVDEGRIVTAGIATARLAAERAGAGSSAFVIGAPAFHDSAAEAGLVLLEDEAGRGADAVLVSGHRGFDYEELLTATLALQAGASLFATSRDPTLPMPGGAWPGTGSILAAVETASGARAEIGGKPERHLFDQARALIGNAERVAMVGDRIASDIEGGRRAGLATILVLSGASTGGEAESAEHPPDRVLEDLSGLLR